MSTWYNKLSAIVLASLLAACAPQGVREESISSPARLNVELGKAYIHEGDYKQAMTKLQRAVAQSPNYPEAHGTLAILHWRLGELDQAERAFREAISLDPKEPQFHNNYGVFLCERGRYEAAEEQFMQALANPLYETPEHAYTNAGLCALRAGNRDRAETHFRAALQRNPKFAPALLRMGEISYDKELYLQSRAYLQRYGEVAPPTAESLWLGVRAERKLGDRDAAASYALRLRSRFPDSEQTRALLESNKHGQ